MGCKGAGEFVRVFSWVPSMFDPLEVKVLFPTRWRKAEREGVAGKPRDLSNDRRQKTPILFGLAEVSRDEAPEGRPRRGPNRYLATRCIERPVRYS